MNTTPLLPLCKHNGGVECPKFQRKCETCGWNPDVIKKRKEEVRKKRAAEAKDCWRY